MSDWKCNLTQVALDMRRDKLILDIHNMVNEYTDLLDEKTIDALLDAVKALKGEKR